MGWFGDLENHEGYPIALERDDESGTVWIHGERYRELGGPCDHDRKIPGLVYLRVACECGWRSEVIRAPSEWAPACTIVDNEFDNDRARELWAEHCRQVQTRGADRLVRPSS